MFGRRKYLFSKFKIFVLNIWRRVQWGRGGQYPHILLQDLAESLWARSGRDMENIYGSGGSYILDCSRQYPHFSYF